MGSGKGKSKRTRSFLGTRADESKDGKFYSEIRKENVALIAEEVGGADAPSLFHLLLIPTADKGIGNLFTFWFSTEGGGAPIQIHAKGEEVKEYTFDFEDLLKAFQKLISYVTLNSGTTFLNNRHGLTPVGPGAGEESLAVAFNSSKHRVTLHEMEKVTGAMKRDALATFHSKDILMMLEVMKKRPALTDEFHAYQKQQIEQSHRRSVIMNRYAQPEQIQF